VLAVLEQKTEEEIAQERMRSYENAHGQEWEGEADSGTEESNDEASDEELTVVE